MAGSTRSLWFGTAFLMLVLSYQKTEGCGDPTLITMAEKIVTSHYVVYGQVVSVTMDPPSGPGVNTSTVLMSVFCVLKGVPQPQFINITKAGKRGAGHCFTNRFNIGKKYVAFLRKLNGELIPNGQEIEEIGKDSIFNSCGLSNANTCPNGFVKTSSPTEFETKISECPVVTEATCPPYIETTTKKGKRPRTIAPTLIAPTLPQPTPTPIAPTPPQPTQTPMAPTLPPTTTMTMAPSQPRVFCVEKSDSPSTTINHGTSIRLGYSLSISVVLVCLRCFS